MLLLPRRVTMMIWSQPECAASSAPYGMIGLSMRGSICLGCALVGGKRTRSQSFRGKYCLANFHCHQCLFLVFYNAGPSFPSIIRRTMGNRPHALFRELVRGTVAA